MMNIVILAVGKSRTEFLDTAIAEYQKRLGRWVRVEWRFIPTSEAVKESQQLLTFIPPGSHVVLLDERGAEWSSVELADYVDGLQNQSTKTLTFIIGGAHGVTNQLTGRADAVLSLSRFVFPHELVRLILIEQLYRAYDINAGGKYHHV